MQNNSIFFQVTVLDNQDPMMLGRIRAKLLIDNYDDIVRAINDPPWNEEKDAWTTRDPFVFSPLMPYFMYQVPKPTEMAQVLYVNKDFKYQHQVSSAIFDFFILKSNILIEVDGDFHHCNPNSIHSVPIYPIQIKTVGNDIRKNRIAQNNNFKLIRFWESDINNNIDQIIAQIKEIILA